MKRIEKRYIHSKDLAGLIAFLLLFFSCTVDNERYPDGPKREGEEVGITLRMPVETATTRALTDDDENEVKTVDILIFRPSDKQFVEVVSTDDITPDDVYNNLKTFYVKLRGEVILDLVVLGNARDILRNAFPLDEDMEGLNKEEILSKLILPYEGPWVDAAGKPIRPFPMWGFRDNANVKEDEFTGEENAIRMTRMVVRIDVHVAPAAQNDFKLTEVYLYNSSLEGNLAHSTTTGWDITEHKATAPDLPQNLTTKWRVDYKDSPSPVTTPNVSSERVIYTLEAPAGDEDKLLYTTALVVGGIYENETYYYRIDFMEKDQQQVSRFIPLLRNHNYEINIQEVLGKGYTDPDDAFRKGMTNMELDILAWNEANMGNITFGAQYQLVVSTDSLYFYSNGREQTMNIYTDYPDGWTIEEKTNLDWLTISDLSGTTKVMTPIEISATTLTLSEGVDYRTGYFYIRAGNMRKKVIIYQSLLEELYLEIDPTSLLFRKNGRSPKSVTVTIDPVSLPVYVSDAGTMEWLSGGFPISGLVGETEYSFQPTVNKTGKLLTSTVTFSISDETGRTTTRTLSILQLPTDNLFDITFEYEKYPPAGGSGFYLEVNSEFDWEIKKEDIYPAGILTAITEGIQNAGVTRYYFNLAENPYFTERTIYLPVLSTHSDFEPFTIGVTQDYDKPWLQLQNSIHRHINFGMVLDGEETQKAQSVYFNVNSDWTFSTDGDYSIVATSDKTEGQNYSGGVPNYPQQQSITFTPYVYKNEVGTPAEYTVVTGSATLTTTNHLQAEASTETVNLTTIVPPLLDESTIKIISNDERVLKSGDIELLLNFYTLYAEIGSNVNWTVRNSTGYSVSNPAQDWSITRRPIRVTDNTTWEEEAGLRDVTFYYTNNNVEKEILTVKQRGYHFTSITPSDEMLTGWISGKAQTASLNHLLTIKGYLPYGSFIVRQISTNSGNELSRTVNATIQGTFTYSFQGYINWTGDIENCTFEYTYDGLKDEAERRWHHLITVNQWRGNMVLSNGSSVSVDYLSNITWAEAMGIDPKYNQELFNGVDAEGNYVATHPTGCNSYSEGPYGAGEWRMPTIAELNEMLSSIEQWVGSASSNQYISTSTENDAETVFYRRHLSTETFTVNKNTVSSYSNLYRCVSRQKNLPTDK